MPTLKRRSTDIEEREMPRDDLKGECKTCALTGDTTKLNRDGRCPYELKAIEENTRARLARITGDARHLATK